MDPRRLVALGGVAVLLAGCSSSGVHPATAAVTTPSTTRPTRTPTHPAVARKHRAHRLALLPPGCRPGQLRLGPGTPDGAAGTDYLNFPVRLVSGRPCTLRGTPEVRFFGASGAPLPFAVDRRAPQHERRGPVLVDPRHSPVISLTKYRCDTVRNPPLVASVVVTLPLGAGTLAGSVPPTSRGLPFCPGDEGDQRVHIGPIGSWLTTGRPPSRHVAVSMHSAFAPLGRPTWGRADLNGDGRPDLVVVRPSGRVVVRIGRQVLRARVPGRPTDRLQGFTDLTGDGRPEILVGSTALGCDAGYRFCASTPSVLTLRDGRLRLVHFPEPAVSWDDGQGELYAGLVCGAQGPTQVQVLMMGLRGYRLTRTTYRVVGLRAHAVARSTVHGTGSATRITALAATRCPGLDHDGWAPERGPLG